MRVALVLVVLTLASLVQAALPPEEYERLRQVAPVVIGSLAALAVQRLIFGWAAPLGVVSWDGERLVSPRWEPCALHLQG